MIFSTDTNCPKCGNTGITDHYVSTPRFAPLFYEYIERRCGYCGYVWAERPLDCPAPTETGEPPGNKQTTK